MLRKSFVFMVMLGMIVGILVACGGEEDGEEDSSAGQKENAKAEKTQKPEPIDAVQVAYKNTMEEETARVVFSMDMSGEPAGTDPGQSIPMEFSMDGRGVMDLSGQKSRMTMRMGPLGKIEMRMIDTVVYQKMPEEMRAQMPQGKPWIETDLDSLYEQQHGMSFSEMQGGASTDPARQLEYLRGVSDSVEEVGKEEVRGVQTTHYRAVMDLEKAFAEQGDDAQKAYDQMVEQIGTNEIPVDVWLDAENRVRRYEMNMPLNIPGGQTAPGGATTEAMQGEISMTQEYFDFGVPVNVSPPPPEKTMSYEELQQQMPQQQPQQQDAAATS